MKIAHCIAAYSIRLNTLPKVADQLGNVFIFSPDKKASHYGVHIPTDPSLKQLTVFEPRRWMLEHLNEYDYFYYSEDDILTRKDQLEYAIAYGNTLPEGCVTGFLRYENKPDGRQFIDLNPIHSVHNKGNGSVRHRHQYGWEPWNVHSGNFILSRQQVVTLIESEYWGTKHSYCGTLESGASNIYRKLTKVLPYDYDKVAVEHLDDKYTGPTDKELTNLL